MSRTATWFRGGSVGEGLLRRNDGSTPGNRHPSTLAAGAGTGRARAFLDGPIPTDLAVAAAVATIVVELAIPALLWSPRTRRNGAALGVAVHLALCLTAISNVTAFGNLVLLNFGLVALYPAFWVDLRPTASGPVIDGSSAATGATTPSTAEGHPSGSRAR